MIISKCDKVKVYNINNNGEYGTFVFFYEEDYLEVICNTSYGVYARTWTAPGNSPYEFLINMPYSTFIYKMSNGNSSIVSRDEQENLMLRMLEDIGKEKELDEYELEGYQNDISELFYSSLMSPEEFRTEVYRSDLFELLYDFDSDFHIIEEDHPHLKNLWNELWIPLLEQLKIDEQLNE